MEITSFTEDELAESLAAVEDYDTEVMTRYSGRGMYGERCFGVVTDHPATVGLAIAHAIALAWPRDSDPDGIIVRAAEIVRAAHHDSFGRQVIVYFPGWQLKGSDPDDPDDVAGIVAEVTRGLEGRR
jgi:hypothetical protein